MAHPRFESVKISRFVLALFVTGLAQIASAQETELWRSWNQPVEPFRIVGDAADGVAVHYVGANDIAAYLITTPDGHILLDGGFVETAPIIESSVEALGFSLDDVKILLNSHAHFDHAGGLARLKERTGAKLAAMDRDAEWLSTGDAGFGPIPPVEVDRVLTDGDLVELGGARLTAHRTGGHTPGCTTWTMQVDDGGKAYDVVFVGSANALAEHDLVADPDYPDIVEDFERTFQTLRGLPVDIFLGSHGRFFRLDAKRERLAAGESAAEVFVDPETYARAVDAAEERFRKELARQRAAAEESASGGEPDQS